MTNFSKLPIPTINLNGANPGMLIESCRKIMDACRELEQTIAQSSALWHGREWQTLPEGSLVQARAQEQWHMRMRKVHELHDEVLEVALAIQKQKHERERT